MFITDKLTEQALTPCPYCRQTFILVSLVSYPKGDDTGYKVACQCGWAARHLHGWESNKARLIEKWNQDIYNEPEISEI